MRLQPGMTVQSVSYGSRLKYALCVKCGWTSDDTSYEKARNIAGLVDSHDCKRKTA